MKRSEAQPAAVAAAPAQKTVLTSLSDATAWLNSRPLTARELHGKPVVVEFWTYTCINWLRTLPYVSAWAKRYHSAGLVVIGVHSPEFGFEHDIHNVRVAADRLRVEFPVAIDNDFKIWHAFGNQYWPALYFIDANGRIRHQQFGEGDYAVAETAIRQLLTESGASGVHSERAVVAAQGIEAPADWNTLQSPETYLGYARGDNFASTRGAVAGKPRLYQAPVRLALNHWALAGNWTVKEQAVELNDGTGRITIRFHARDLHLVLRPPGTAARFRVLIDGRPPGDAHGLDVDSDGYGTITEPRLYQLVRQRPPIEDRVVDVEFSDAGVAAYVFTFG